MISYRVGGSIRDKLLGLPIKDQDWVVVGASISDMLQLGYMQIGKNFPVFLHPESKEEYALARTEKKIGPGYTGFEFISDPTVTLEEDLLRRDLTINAIAESATGELIDPHNGAEDIHNRILRHVSPSFAEDPVRILRIARFAARFSTLGFTIAPETMQLMTDMVTSGEVDHLVEERVWQELHSSLNESQPQVFFAVLRQCSALERLFPEIENLYGIPQNEHYHPEIDTGIHTMMVLQQACRLSQDAKVRFAALVHDLGKATTPKDQWPKHPDHETRGLPLVKALCARYKVPNNFRDLALKVTQYHLHYHHIAKLDANTILETLTALNSFRQADNFELFILACEADSRGRTGYEDTIPSQSMQLRLVFKVASEIDIQAITALDIPGKEIGALIYAKRLSAIKTCIKNF
ncbi:CCA tRNA nucleotidyltransferase [hydrothermal vent metagenome]|uniref:CCA tRNA nucleotidyltransferase n=1 Tax=hydrothermal vent metagenome TaxID=652676 RepID=A0A3B1A1Q5_9ZZZZ